MKNTAQMRFFSSDKDIETERELHQKFVDATDPFEKKVAQNRYLRFVAVHDRELEKSRAGVRK